MADLSKVRYFSLYEFAGRENEVEFAQQELFTALDKYRVLIGEAIHPSPAEGALSRFVGSPTSRHYVDHQKRSDAIDVFIRGDFFKNWRIATMTKLFGGVGLYVDTHFKDVRWPMFHLDTRPSPYAVLWARSGGEYIYPYNGPTSLRLYLEALEEASNMMRESVKDRR